MKAWACEPREYTGEGIRAVVRATSHLRARQIADEYWNQGEYLRTNGWIDWRVRRLPEADGDGDLTEVLLNALEWVHEGEPVGPWWLEECELYGVKGYGERYTEDPKMLVTGDKPDLKRCPSCSGIPRLWSYEDGSRIWVGCCGVFVHCHSKQTAADAWNERQEKHAEIWRAAQEKKQ